MSKTLHFGTKITNPRLLAVACEALRADGLQVVGPRYGTDWPHPVSTNADDKIEANMVHLPGWHHDCLFVCNETGDMFADNFSDYHDERQIDPATGLRIDGTGDVHPDVRSGRKRVGENGIWGDIKHLDRLQAEYSAAVVMQDAYENGLMVTKTALEGVEGGLELTVEIPEMMGQMG